MSKLNILWTTDNKEVFFNVVAMYAINGKNENWWDEIQLIIWGPSARLTATESSIQTEIKELLSAGVKIVACKECADNYQVRPALEKLGIHVFYTGELLTEILIQNEKLLTF